MHKKLLTFVLPLLGLTAIAQEEVTPSPSESLDFTVDNVTYTILDEAQKTCQTKAGTSYIDYTSRSIVINYGNNYSGDVNIPASVQKPESQDSYTVVGIGNYAFDKATSVSIAEGITSIGDYAFYGNTSLASVTIPNSVSYIGRDAFYYCTALTNVTIPSSLTNIAPYTFSYTGITSLEIPENVQSIGDNAFANCAGIQTLNIPSTVSQLGKAVFMNCSALNNLTLAEGITTIPANAFSGCSALTTLEIPASVTSIGDNGFNCSGLTSITCYAKNIPAISANSFNSANYTGATLYVYKTALSKYENSSLWGAFSNIEMIQENATDISILPSTLNINVGLTAQLTAALTPEDATDHVTWEVTSTTPSGCLSIDPNGVVTAKQIGTAVVTASTGSLQATCNVVINANPDEYVVVNPLTKDLYVGDVTTMTALVFPTTITPSLTWSSSNPEVATINELTGELTALAPGGTVITATNDNMSGTLAITVNPILPTGITLNQDAITLLVGQTQTLLATVTPSNVTDPVITWDSNDPSIAVVSDGVVTAMGVGTANIRAMIGDYTANCAVTVNPILAENVTITSTDLTVKVGQSLQLYATVSPENTTDKTVTWISNNPEIATVTPEGEVLGIAQGSASITAECGNASATCTVTVENVPSEGLVLNYSSVTIKIGNTQQLSATLYPDNTTDKQITWTSSNQSVATVENGLVTALAEGTTNITAQNGDQSDVCVVTVEPVLAEQVILDQSAITVNVNGVLALSATVLPENTTDKTLTWTSLNPEIATVAAGSVSGVAPGSTTITVSCGSANASCNVTVLQPATSITLNQTQLDLFVGDLYDLIETVLPANTTDQVVWSSSDNGVAMVDNNGIVTAIKAGSATITATCGDQTATCEVTVSDIPATSVVIDFTELTLKKGQSQQLTATVMPENTTHPFVTWTSSDTSVATVAEDGTVTAVSAGTTTITATCGEVEGTCALTVEDPEENEVVLNYQNYTLKAEQTIQLEVVNPEDVAAEDVMWTSSSSNVATVSSTGLVTAVAVGETVITASYNGESATCVITVVATEAETITLNYSEIRLNVNDTFQLVATVLPDTTTDPTVTWTSTNTEVAVVDEDGFVTALADGTTSIAAMTGNVYAVCIVNVGEGPSSAIDGLSSEEFDGYYRVYNIQGMLILTTQDKADLNNLSSGLYIINGQKVMIR